MIDFLAFILISTGNSLASDILEVYLKKERYPIRLEPPRIGHYTG